MAFARPYTPQFPYPGNQVIISSGRVLLHSKDDSIFLFGKKAIGLSTTGTFNVDADVGVKINAPIIELGLNASISGEPIIKGDSFLIQLNRLLDQISELAGALQQLRSTNSNALVVINNKAQLLKDVTASVKTFLPGTLSTVTFTK